MNYLLDTHVWLWGRFAPERLPINLQALLGADDAVCHLSALSVHEALLLAKKGRLNDPPTAIGGRATDWIADSLRDAGLRELPVTHAIALAAGDLELSTRDPIDLLLVATARVHGLVFVTADRHLAHVPGLRVLSFHPPR